MTYQAYTAIGVFFTSSFLGVVATSTERFLAIYLYLKEQELVTHKRVLVVVITVIAIVRRSAILYILSLRCISYLVYAILYFSGYLSKLRPNHKYEQFSNLFRESTAAQFVF